MRSRYFGLSEHCVDIGGIVRIRGDGQTDGQTDAQHLMTKMSTTENTEEDRIAETTKKEEEVVELKVIVWAKASEICGDDEDFLREVLADLLAESEVAQGSMENSIAKLDSAEDKTIIATEFLAINRAAHQVDGGASYLFCEKLIHASKSLVKLAHEDNTKDLDAPARLRVIDEIKAYFVEFKQARNEIAEEVEKRKISIGATGNQ